MHIAFARDLFSPTTCHRWYMHMHLATESPSYLHSCPLLCGENYRIVVPHCCPLITEGILKQILAQSMQKYVCHWHNHNLVCSDVWQRLQEPFPQPGWLASSAQQGQKRHQSALCHFRRPRWQGLA